MQSLFGDDSPTETSSTISVQITGYQSTETKRSTIKRRAIRSSTVNSPINFTCQMCHEPVTTPTKISGCSHYFDIHCILKHTAIKCKICATMCTIPPIMVLHQNVTTRVPNLFCMSNKDRDRYQTLLRRTSATIAHIKCQYDDSHTLYVPNLDIVQMQVFQNNMDARQCNYR